MEVYPPEDPAPGEVVGGPSVSQLEQMRAWDASLTQLEKVIQEACETEVHPNVNNWSKELTITPVTTSGSSSIKHDVKRKFEEHETDGTENLRLKNVRMNEMLPSFTQGSGISADTISSSCDTLNSDFNTLATIVPLKDISKDQMTHSESKAEKEIDNKNEITNVKEPVTTFDVLETKVFPNSPEKHDCKDLLVEDSKKDLKELNITDSKENIDFADCKKDNVIDDKDSFNLNDCKNVNVKCEINEVKDVGIPLDSEEHDDLSTNIKNQESCLLHNSEDPVNREVASGITESSCNDSTENLENLAIEKKLKDKKKKKDDESSESSKNSKKEDKQGKKKKFERCNIRDIKLEDDLDEVTLAAQKEEQERIRRIQEAHMRALQERLQQIEDEKEVLTQLFSQPPAEASHLFDSNSEGNAEASDDSVTKPDVPLIRNENDVILLDNSENNKKTDLQELIVPPSSENVIDISSSSSDSDSEGEEEDDDELGKKDDDIMVLSDEGDAEPEETSDPNNSGAHTNDCFNLVDMEGRVLVNVGHPPEDPDIFLAPQIAKVIKPHQIGGIRFLYDNVVENLERYKSSSGFGCILAHSMGLGKTVQVVSFVDVFLRHTPATLVLCIVPINTIQNWKAEFDMWVPSSNNVDEALVESGEIRPRDYNVYTLNENFKSMAGRSTLIAEWRKQGGVLLMGYEMYRMLALRKMPKIPVKKSKRQKKLEANVEPETNEQIKKFMDQMYEHIVIPGPDLVICDEGHRIKNSLASTSMALKSIKTRRRVVLTGYPLQNNLLEYWCMVDFVRPNYLGSRAEFCNMFERPISNGQCTDSTPRDRQLMRFRSHVLHSLLVGFVQRRGHSVLRAVLPKKEEHVLLIRMTPIQRKLYKCFVKDLLYVQQATNPLKLFAVCCKIWNHPDILYKLLQEKKAHEDIDLDIDLSTLAPGSALPGSNSVLKRKGVAIPKDQKSKGIQRPIRATPQPAKIQPKNVKQLALLPPPSPQSQGQQLLPVKIEPQQLCGDQLSSDGQNCKHMPDQIQYPQQHSNQVSMQDYSSTMHSQSKSPHSSQQQNQYHQPQHLDYSHSMQHEFPPQQSVQTSFQQSQFASPSGSQQFCQPKYSQQQYQQQSQKCQSHYHQQQFTSQPNTQPSPPSQYSQQPILQQQFPSQSQNLGSQQQFSTSPSISQQSYMQQPSQSQQQYSPSSTTPQQSSVQTQQQFSQQQFSPQSVTPSPQQFSQKPSGQSPQQFPQSPSAPQHQSTPQSQQSYPHSASQSFSVQSSAQQEPQFHPQSPTQHQHFSQQTVSQQFTQSSTSQQQYQSTSNSQQFTQQHAAQQQFSHSAPSQQSFVPPSSTQQQSYSQQQQPQTQQPPSQQQSYSKQSQPPPGQQQQQFLSQTQQFPPQPNSQPQFQQASQQQQYCQQSNNVQPFSQQSTKLKEQTQYCQQSSQPQYSQPNTQQQYSQQQYSQQQNTQQQQYSQQSNVQQKQQYAQQGNAQQQFSCHSPPQSQFNQQSHVTPQNFPQVSPQQQFSQPSPPLPSQQFSQPSPQSQFSQQSPPQKYPRQSPPQQMFPQASPPVQQFSQPSPSQQFPHQSSPQQLPSPQQYSQSSPTQVYSQQFSQHSPSPYTQPSPPHQKYSQLQHQYSQEPSTQQPYQSSQISQYPQQPSPHQPYSQLPQQSASQQQYSQQSQQYIHTGQQYPRQGSPQQNFSQSLQKQYSQANQQQYSHQSIQQQAQYSQQPPAQNPFSQQQQQQSNSHSQFSQPSSQASQQQFPLPPSQVQQYGTSQTQSTAQQQFNRQSPISSSPPQFTQQQPSQQQFVQQQQQTSSQPQFTQQTQTSSQHQFNQQSTSSQQQQFNQKQATQSQQQYSQQISQTSISQKYNQQNIKSPSSQSYTQPSQSGSTQYQQPYSQQPPQSSPSPQYAQHNQGGQTQQYQHSFNQQTNQQQVNQSFQQQFTQNQPSTPSSLQPIAQVPPTKQGKGVGRGKQARGKQVCQVPPPPYTQQAAEKPFSPQNYQQHSPLQAVVQRQNLPQTAKQPQKRINQHHFQPIVKQEGITLLPVKQEPNTVPAKCQKAILQSMKQPCQALVHSRQQMQPSLIKKQQPDCAPMENEQENGGTVQEVGMLAPYRDRIDSSISYEWAIPLMKDYVLGVLENSHKMMVLFEIIEETLHVGDKLLVFSQSLSTLDLLEHFLNKEKIPKCSDSSEDLPSEHWCRNKNYFRLDGSTSAQEREKLINEFNNNDKISLFLLSTRAGCLGINLVGANRIVVMDASWNPCHDAQAVCRIYRYGQKKPCHIYRLVTDNSLEKRIYDRQVNKQGMSDRVVDELNPESNFTWKDVTTLIQDDEDDGPAQDLTNFASSYTDEVLKYLVTKMSASLSKEPFEHESLLLDRKDLKLTKQEKRMAKQSYEMAKRANMINIRTTYTYLPAGSTGTGGQFIINNKQCQWVGGTTIRVLPTQSTSVSVQSGTGATLRSGTTATPITASPALMSNLFKQGVMVQKLTMPSNISIPVLTPGAPPVVIPAGQDVLVLRTPKGVYLRLPDGRIIAVQLPPSLLAKTQFRPNVVTHFRPAQKGNNQTAVVNSGRGQSIGIIKQTLQCGGTVRFIGPRNSAGGSSQNTARQAAPEVIDLSDDDEPSAKKCSASSNSSTNSIDNESGTAEQQQQESSQDPQAKPSPVPIQQKQITIRRISPASQPNTIQLPSVQGKCELPMALQQSQQITIMPINPSAQQQSRSKSVPTVSQSVSVKPMVLPNPSEKRKVTAKNATKIQLPMPLLSAKHLQQNQVTISPAPQFQPQLQQSKLRQTISSQLTIKPQESLPVAITPVSQQLHADLKTATQPVQSSVQTDNGQSHPSPQPQLVQSLPISQSQQNTQPAQLTQVQHMPRPALKQSQSQLETTQPQSHSSPVLSQHNNPGQLQVSQSASSPQTLLQPASLTSQTQASNIPLHQPHIPPQQNPLVIPPKMQQHPNSSEPQHSHLTHSYVQQKQTSLHPAQSSTVTSQPVHPNPSAIQPRKRKQPSNRQTSKKTSATQPNVQNNMRPAQPSEIAHQFPHAQLPDPHLPDNLFPPFSHLPSSDFQTFAAFSPHKPVPQIQHPQPLHPLQHNQEHSLPSHLQHMAHMYPLQHIPASQPSISDLQPQAPRAWPVPQPPVSSFHPFGQSSPYYNSGHSHESNQFSFQSSFTSSQPPTTSSITQSEQSNVSGIDQPPSICSSEL